MEARKRSLWARSTFFRICCYSAASSLLICLIVELSWSLSPPTSLRLYSGSPLESHLRELSIVACGTFWVTFALVGLVLGLREKMSADPVVGARLLAALFAALIVISVALAIFVIPFGQCPNCFGPEEKQAEGTHGVVVDGKYITTGCWGCNGRRVTLYRKWTWPDSE